MEKNETLDEFEQEDHVLCGCKVELLAYEPASIEVNASLDSAPVRLADRWIAIHYSNY